MITTLMLYSLAIGLVLGGGACVADRLVQRTTVARRWTYVGALALLALLTFSAPWRAGDDRLVAAVQATQTAVPGDQLHGARTNGAAARMPGTPAQATLLTRSLRFSQQLTSRVTPQLDRTLGVAWATASALFLVSIGVMSHRLSRQRRQWPRAVLQGVTVRVSHSSGPAVYGVFRPEIVLPAAVLHMCARDQQLMLAHEQAHVRARDPLLLAINAAVIALLPWHPVAWWLASRVRLAVELDCDARVLRAERSPRDYAQLLLTIAQHVRRTPNLVGVSALLSSRSHLERRLLAMTIRPSRSRTHALAVAALVLAVSAVVACAAPVPVVAEGESSALFATYYARDVITGARNFTIDDQPATFAQAYALKRSEVASVFIQHNPTDSTQWTTKLKTRKEGSPEPHRVLYLGSWRPVNADSINKALSRRDSIQRR